MNKDTRERLSLRVSPVTDYRLRAAYKKAGCRRRNEPRKGGSPRR